jgi:transketolase
MKLPRDVFIDELFELAKKDKTIMFLCADLGAKSLDRFREELPEQFVHVGICEQNMIDLAAGLAQNGKKVFCYAMSCFLTLRCLEQIKVALCAMELPVTLLGVGAGLSYEDAGPTHYSLEDIACLRSLPHLEVITPGDEASVKALVKDINERKAIRYVRLDRRALPPIYREGSEQMIREGVAEVSAGEGTLILTQGHTHQLATLVAEKFAGEGKKVAVADVFSLPLNTKSLAKVVEPYEKLITLEEHFLPGGMGSAIAEALFDLGVSKKMLRLGLESHYYLQNGGREYIRELHGLGQNQVMEKVAAFLS